jgi:O-acetyl-ADP-ribose deacetylase (regulator of RNase III)
MQESKIKNTIVRLQTGDLTAMEIEAIVFYASHDLVLGAGFGSAIAARGGMSIQEELKSIGSLSTGEAVVTSAGKLNSNFIVHAVGPRFQESDTDLKLRTTIENSLKAADEKGIRKLAFPPMGYGFYGIPLDLCAKIMLEVIRDYVSISSSFEEIIICVIDNREYDAFKNKWNILE